MMGVVGPGQVNRPVEAELIEAVKPGIESVETRERRDRIVVGTCSWNSGDGSEKRFRDSEEELAADVTGELGVVWGKDRDLRVVNKVGSSKRSPPKCEE